MTIRIACALAAIAAVAATGPAASAAIPEFVRFRSPSGNIECILWRDGGYVRCDIHKRTWRTRRPARCPRHSDYGQGLEVSQRSRRGQVVCANDAVGDGIGRRLGYGRRVRRWGITCTSTRRGITCRNRRGHGFFLSRRSYRLF